MDTSKAWDDPRRRESIKSGQSQFEGAYCALMDGANFVKIVYCPCTTLVPVLKGHLRTVTGSTFQKVFSPIERFADLPNAIWTLRP